MKVFVIVVTYNQPGLLKKNIGVSRRQQNLDQIAVVNNGSNDDAKEWLGGQHDLHVTRQENVGGSGGLHIGTQVVYDEGIDRVWHMDDDVFPKDGCLDELLSLMVHEETQLDRKKPLDILVPWRTMNGKTFVHEFRRYNLTSSLGSLHAEKLNGEETTPTEIVGCDFGGPFISRSVIEKIGLPDRGLFTFYDDTEYCPRTHLAGFRLLYMPSAVMDKHTFSSEDSWVVRNQKKKWKRYYRVRNSAYLNRHCGKNWGVRYLGSWISGMGHVIPALLSMPFSKVQRPKDLIILHRAYCDGINERLGRR